MLKHWVATLILFNALMLRAQTSLQQQAQQFIKALHKSDNYPTNGLDTLIDLNRDGYKDILIEYYGMSGTGLKNRVNIYPYDTVKKKFTRANMIDLTNPTFYFSTNTIASYYIAYGGGGAAMHHWKGTRLEMYEEIDVAVEPLENDNILFKHTQLIIRTGKIRKWTDSVVNLPAKYKYDEYVPVIKRKTE